MNMQATLVSQDIIDRCPCLKDSSYKDEASKLISLNAPASSDWDLHKIMAVYRICFHFRKLEEDKPAQPDKAFAKILDDVTHYLKAAIETMPPYLYPSQQDETDKVEDVTADHYGNLFSYFNDEKYYEEPSELLGQRLERNGFDLSWLNGKSVLDAGCGNGRYTYALSNLGASKVTGLDMSKTNIADAEKRLSGRPREGVSYQLGSVLDMPFKDGEFDFVFSNGVLHHTTDLDKGLEELVRVMKPEGRGFLMLINDPGGIKWDMIEICRELLRDVPYRYAHDIFLKLNMPTHLRFLYLDHILVPINIRLSAKQISDKLASYGATDIERLERGADVDEFEKFENYADKEILWGSGIHRFLFSKK